MNTTKAWDWQSRYSYIKLYDQEKSWRREQRDTESYCEVSASVMLFLSMGLVLLLAPTLALQRMESQIHMLHTHTHTNTTPLFHLGFYYLFILYILDT